MKKVLVVVLILTTYSLSGSAQQSKWIADAWILFSQVNFKPQFFKEMNETFLVPVFTSSIRAKAGTEISVSGYYMPVKLEGQRIILSKYPYSACFFCGGAGPESVVEVVLSGKKPKLRTDQVISVKGKLRFNDTDVEHMSFIIYDAILIE